MAAFAVGLFGTSGTRHWQCGTVLIAFGIAQTASQSYSCRHEAIGHKLHQGSDLGRRHVTGHRMKDSLQLLAVMMCR